METINDYKLGLDLDDVIYEFIPSFLRFYNSRYSKEVRLEDLTTFNLWECGIGQNRDEAIGYVREFYNSEDYENMDLVIGIGELIKELSYSGTVPLITARTIDFKLKTVKSIENHFPNSDTHIVFTSDFHSGNGETKANICRKLGIKTFVEDNINYALNVAQYGIKVFLRKRPWNIRDSYPENISVVEDMNEVLLKLKEGVLNGFS